MVPKAFSNDVVFLQKRITELELVLKSHGIPVMDYVDGIATYASKNNLYKPTHYEKNLAEVIGKSGNMVRLVRLLQKYPLDYRAAALLVPCDERTARLMLIKLHKNKFCFVAGWVKLVAKFIPAYQWGIGTDAAKPPSKFARPRPANTKSLSQKIKFMENGSGFWKGLLPSAYLAADCDDGSILKEI